MAIPTFYDFIGMLTRFKTSLYLASEISWILNSEGTEIKKRFLIEAL